MSASRRRWLVAVAASALLAGLSGPVTAQAGVPGRMVVADPASGQERALSAVSAISRSDAWAVGRSDGPDGSSTALILRWDGASWTTVHHFDSGPDSILNGVSADSARDAWAVGLYCAAQCAGAPVDEALIVHWNGSAWTRVPTPDPSSTFNVLYDVSADSPTDAWAVGLFQGPVATKTFVLHWDGASWSRVNSPDPGSSFNQIDGVAAISPADVWVSGFSLNFGAPRLKGLLLHWNGSRWSPKPREAAAADAVTSISARNVWAVGSTGSGPQPRTLGLHWNGSSWSRTPTPDPGPGFNEFYSVGAASGTDVWAVGSDCAAKCGRFGEVDEALIGHWDGAKWSRIRCPDPNPRDNELLGVTAVSSHDAWAVGFAGTHGLILHWNGSTWSQASL